MKNKTIQKEVKSPVVVPVTHSLILEQFFNYKKTYVKDTVLKNYKTAVDQFFNFVKKDVRLVELKDINDFYHELLKTRKQSTAITHLSAIKTFYMYVVEMGHSQLPYRLIKFPRTEEQLRPYVTEEEFLMIDLFLSEQSKIYRNIKMRLVIRMLWETGCRISEILNLKMSDLNFDTFTDAIILRRKVKRKEIIVWSDDTRDVLLEYLTLRDTKEKIKESIFLFPNKNNEVTRGVEAVRWLKKLTRALEIEKNITPHSFRHGRAHFIISKKGTQSDVKVMLGHGSIESSDRYMLLDVDEQRKIKGRLI